MDTPPTIVYKQTLQLQIYLRLINKHHHVIDKKRQ